MDWNASPFNDFQNFKQVKKWVFWPLVTLVSAKWRMLVRSLEYGRLNITHHLLSTRRLKYLVVNIIVRGWNDPRLLTLNGLRRRGLSLEAINDFRKRVGVSRTTKGYTRYELLEACARQDMDLKCPNYGCPRTTLRYYWQLGLQIRRGICRSSQFTKG